MKLVLLDRNAVSRIKQKLSGKKIPDEMDRALRLLDRKDNKISAILSIREGQSGKRENKQQIKETLKIETDAIARFFKKATTDSSILANMAENFSEIFSVHTELKWEEYASFADKVQIIVLEPKSKKDKEIEKENIINIAIEIGISPSHPIVICYLSVLYGCQGTRKIVKPKENRTEDENNKALYNVLNDILVLSRLLMIQAITDEDKYRNQHIKYFTFDKGLDFFIKSFKINRIETVSDGVKTATITNVTCSRKLFPDLDEDSYIELMKKIDVKSQ